MKTFHITVERTERVTYEVKADDAEAAVNAWFYGDSASFPEVGARYLDEEHIMETREQA